MRAAVGAYARLPCRARAAERFVAEARSTRGPPPTVVVEEFGRLEAMAAEPVDGGGAGAAYRRRALRVLASRGLHQVWGEYLALGPR